MLVVVKFRELTSCSYILLLYCIVGQARSVNHSSILYSVQISSGHEFYVLYEYVFNLSLQFNYIRILRGDVHSNYQFLEARLDTFSKISPRARITLAMKYFLQGSNQALKCNQLSKHYLLVVLRSRFL